MTQSCRSTWEIASRRTHAQDRAHRRRIRLAASWAHSVHVEPVGLEPDRAYWYRFTAGGRQSPVGRTRTAPRGDAARARMRIAVASCQQYEHGYFLGYRHMLEDELDLVAARRRLHLRSELGRAAHPPSQRTGSGCARRLPRTPRAVSRRARAAGGACCLSMAGHVGRSRSRERLRRRDVSEEDDARDWFLARRAAAYQAYYEHMPLAAARAAVSAPICGSLRNAASASSPTCSCSTHGNTARRSHAPIPAGALHVP